MFDFSVPFIPLAPLTTTAPMDTYDVLRKAFNFFNKELFQGKLSESLIILHRHRSAYGYFHPSHMAAADGVASTEYDRVMADPIHEVALNPKHIRERDAKATMATLVHEMVHQQQEEYGKPPKTAYHNKQWAQMMKEVGLYPSDTAKPGGAETGRYVSHFIMEGGRFDKAFEAFAKAQSLDLFGDLPLAEKKKVRTSKYKFACPDCDQVCWAKAGANLMCGECETGMEFQG